MRFDDTSSPSQHDWTFYVNGVFDSSNWFAIGDQTTGTNPFTVTGGAPTNSIFVDSTGRVGLGTSTPNTQLHLQHITPFIRFEKIVGMPKSDWAIGAGSDGFLVVDRSTGMIPLRVKLGAAGFSLVIDESGDVGMGTSSPEAKLHVASFGAGSTDGKLLVKNTSLTTSGRELIEGNNNGTALIVLDDAEAAGNRWAFGSAAGGSFLWDNQADLAVEMSLDTAGNLTTTGTVNGVSSREAKTGFAALDPKATLSRVASLPISTWSYKADGPGVRHAGPMSEDFYQAFQLGQDDKHISFTDSAGIALAAVQGLDQVVGEKDQEVKSRLEALERMVRALIQAKAETP